MQKVNRHKWTVHDYELLRLYYDGTTASTKRLVELIGASHQGVKQKAIKLNLTKRQIYKEWSVEENERLQKLTPTLSPKRIGDLLNRTESAVRIQQQRLKFSPNHRDWFTAQDLETLFNVHFQTASRWLESGILKARRYDSPQGQWQITTKDLRDFVLKYPSELQGRKVDMVFLVDLLTSHANGSRNGC